MDINAYRTKLLSFYGNIDWEWFCTMNLREGVDVTIAEIFLKRWRIRVCRREHIRVCYVGLLSMRPQPHLHLLMAGLDHYGHTLADRVWFRSESAWEVIAKRDCVIQPILHEPDRVLGYITHYNTPADRFELLIPYGERLLEKKRQIKLNPELAPERHGWFPYDNDNILLEGYLKLIHLRALRNGKRE